ncbi:MAG: hypothetical protein CMA10_04615 [Euryarchaeota archaeon]|nr:hypothetical protein [Euryarchaeota archaeon]|tara:strand:+ start:366 stop:881 length:516 start_codon:yes stop_codon:yes gene_type:complete
MPTRAQRFSDETKKALRKLGPNPTAGERTRVANTHRLTEKQVQQFIRNSRKKERRSPARGSVDVVKQVALETGVRGTADWQEVLDTRFGDEDALELDDLFEIDELSKMLMDDGPPWAYLTTRPQWATHQGEGWVDVGAAAEWPPLESFDFAEVFPKAAPTSLPSLPPVTVY